jgi:hypothetical protein
MGRTREATPCAESYCRFPISDLRFQSAIGNWQSEIPAPPRRNRLPCSLPISDFRPFDKPLDLARGREPVERLRAG